MPPFPDELTYLWNAFWRLRGRRGGSGFGPQPIGWPDIAAFGALTGISFNAWEIGILETLDNLYLSVASNPDPGNT